jgi:VWFA-related protein
MANPTARLFSIRLAPAVVTVLALLTCLPAAAPRAQETENEPPEESPLSRPFLERERVRLVLVPVTVVDRKGRPVLDLQQGDFDLFVDGSPQPIDAFEPPLVTIEEPVEPSAADADAGSVATRGTPRSSAVREIQPVTEIPIVTKSYVALVFDRYMTTYRGVARAFSALRGFLEEGGSPLQEIGLFAVVHGNIRTLQPFTSDPLLLETALGGAFKDGRQLDSWLTEERERQLDVLGVPEPLWCGAISKWSVIQAQRGRNVLMGLERLARAMAELKGRKSVVLLTDGVRLRAGLNYAYILNRGGSHKGYRYESCTMSLQAEYQRMTRTFKAANVTLSPVSMMGLTFPARGDPNALDELLGSSRFMAEETGGRVPMGLNDFQGEVTSAVEQPLRSYVLGFRATESVPGTAHAIEVRVRRKRVRISARSEYVEPPETFATDSRFSSALLFPGRDRELGGEAALFALPVTRTSRELHIQVAVPGEALAWLAAAEGRRQAELQVNGLLRDERGRADEVLKSAYVVKAGAGRPPSRLVIQESVVADVKRPSELVLVALDQVSGLISSWAIPVAGPGKTKAPMLVTEPILLAAAGKSQVISTGGDPRLSRRLQERLYIPVAGLEEVTGSDADQDPGASGDRVLVMSRIVNLPEGGSVRFCLNDGRYITAELSEDAPEESGKGADGKAEDATAEDARAEEAAEEIVQAELARTAEATAGSTDGGPSLWSAWMKVPVRALASGDIRVEVVSAEGALLTAKVAEEAPGDRPAP